MVRVYVHGRIERLFKIQITRAIDQVIQPSCIEFAKDNIVLAEGELNILFSEFYIYFTATPTVHLYNLDRIDV